MDTLPSRLDDPRWLAFHADDPGVWVWVAPDPASGIELCARLRRIYLSPRLVPEQQAWEGPAERWVEEAWAITRFRAERALRQGDGLWIDASELTTENEGWLLEAAWRHEVSVRILVSLPHSTQTPGAEESVLRLSAWSDLLCAAARNSLTWGAYQTIYPIRPEDLQWIRSHSPAS